MCVAMPCEREYAYSILDVNGQEKTSQHARSISEVTNL